MHIHGMNHGRPGSGSGGLLPKEKDHIGRLEILKMSSWRVNQVITKHRERKHMVTTCHLKWIPRLFLIEATLQNLTCAVGIPWQVRFFLAHSISLWIYIYMQEFFHPQSQHENLQELIETVSDSLPQFASPIIGPWKSDLMTSSSLKWSQGVVVMTFDIC